MAPTYDSATKTPTCNCGAPMVLRNGKYGKFYGCSTFPKCRQTRPYNGDAPQAEPETPKQAIVWSAYQQAIFALAEDLATWKHLVIKAGAGSGKTTVGVEFAKRLPKDLTVAFVAFNRKIARTFAAKLPPHVESSTLHSRGLGNAKNALGDVRVDGRKVWYIIKDLTDRMDFDRAEVVDQSISSIQRLVSLCKANLMEPTDENLDYIADRWNVEVNGDRDVIYETTRQAFRQSVEDTATIDYDDMIHLTATGRVPARQFDVLVIDETQDLNKANLEMVVRSVKPDGHIVAVGDENQSIYGFRGADTDAMPNIIERLNAKVLPLSITYRVPKSGVALANTLVPELEAAPDAENGILESVSEYAFLDMVRPGDLVLCRTNAPLVSPCFDLIRQGVKAVILGRDIGKGLMALVKKIQKRHRVRSMDDTLEALAEYRRKEIAKFLAADKEMQAQLLDDKVETIFALADGCYTVAELERKVERVFSDDAAGVTFSTVHKSKGGEADRVFILKPELMPHPKAGDGWEMTQEWNIAYVSFTRHKKALYFVGGMPPFTVPGDDEDDVGFPYEDMTDEEIDLAWEEHEAAEAFQEGVRQVVDETLDALKADDGSYTTEYEDAVRNMPQSDDADDWLEWKSKFAAREAEQERAAFASDPDYQLAQAYADGEITGMGYALLKGPKNVLHDFPKEGRFESNIFRPSAWELAAALPDWMPTIEANQLVLVKDLAPGHVVKCYTSILAGQIAGGTGDDSIRVVREDQGRDGRKFHFKNPQNWVNRRVPQDVTTNEAAAAHLAAKVEGQVEQMTRPCSECGALRVKCKAGKGRDARFWWKATCEHRVKEGGW